MFFVIVGVAFVALHFAGVAPFSAWTWAFTGDLWKFVTPFLLALAWWAWADASGLTRRREMERDAKLKADRRARNISALGLGPKDPRSGSFRRR